MNKSNSLYETLEDVADAAKKALGDDCITPEFLKKLGLRKRHDGYYRISDIVRLFLSLEKPKVETYQKEIEFEQVKKLHTEAPIIRLDPIASLSRTAQIEIYSLFISIYDSEMSQFIRDMRKLLSLPTKGLSSYLDRPKWLTKTAIHLKKHGYADEINKNKAFLVIKLMLGIYLQKSIRGYKEKSFESKRLLVTSFFDYLTLNDPFFSISHLNKYNRRDKSPEYGIKIPIPPSRFLDDNIEIHFCVYNSTTKDEVRKIIDRVWPKIESYKRRFPQRINTQRIKDLDILRQKLKVLELRQEGVSYKQIASELKTNVGRVRKMANDIKKERNI